MPFAALALLALQPPAMGPGRIALVGPAAVVLLKAGCPCARECRFALNALADACRGRVRFVGIVDADARGAAGSPWYDATHPAAFRALSTYAYDGGGRLASVATVCQTRPDGGSAFTSTTTMFQNQCAYETSGANRGLKTSSAFSMRNDDESYAGRTETYGYDASLDYLTSANYGDGLPNQAPSWSYDAAGNRGDAAVDNLNRATSVGGHAATNDVVGNRLLDAGHQYGWDCLNRMVNMVPLGQATLGKGGETNGPVRENEIASNYRYGADGMLAWKQVGSARTYFYYDEEGDPTFETDASGSVTATNVFAPDGLVARRQGGSWIDYAFDPQGNVAQRTDASGNVLSSSAYDAYGYEATTSSLGDPWGYSARAGYYKDAESGLCYCMNRYYDPGAGRWLTTDPIGVAGGINLYAYCDAGPVGSADPDGLTVIIAGASPHDENEIRRQLKRIGAKGSPLQQMMYDLINDKRPHYKRPLPPNSPVNADNSTYPRSNYQGDTVYYKPWVSLPIPGTGDFVSSPCGIWWRSDIPFPPDVVLAHELGHQSLGSTPAGHRKRADPGGGVGVPGTRAQAGDNVADVENPYRKWQGLQRRAVY